MGIQTGVLHYQRAIIETLGEVAEQFTASIGDQQIIFDANTELPLEIHTWLDGQHHSAAERLGAGWTHAGIFVNFESKTVPQSVTECLGETGFGEDGAGGGIDLNGRDAVANGGNRCELRFENGLVSGFIPVGIGRFRAWVRVRSLQYPSTFATQSINKVRHSPSGMSPGR